MEPQQDKIYTAFAGHDRIAVGRLQDVALAVKKVVDAGHLQPVLVFDHHTSVPVDLDVRGTKTEVSNRYRETAKVEETSTPKGRGRPKLGVVGREVTLLPRHWSWLQEQSGGASVALRKLVDQARKDNKTIDEVRHSRNSTNSFMNAIAGNLAGFEEATRALYAGDLRRFNFEIELWPKDIKQQLNHLSGKAFGDL